MRYVIKSISEDNILFDGEANMVYFDDTYRPQVASINHIGNDCVFIQLRKTKNTVIEIDDRFSPKTIILKDKTYDYYSLSNKANQFDILKADKTLTI